MKVRKIGFCIIMLIGAFVLAACGASKEVMTDEMAKQEGKSIGKIYLYGEEHSVQEILDRELEEWEEHYNDEGMRHLFIEKPYYTAEFLNLWMQADNDEILDEIYEDTEGTAACTPQSKAFYKHIKEQCPETIFHGTDVGHQYDTIGKRYLEYLKANGLEEAEQYILAKDCIEQGMHYYD